MPPKAQNNGEEAVSLSQVRDLLNQQKDWFMQLLQQQESNFKTVVDILVNNVNKRIDQLTKETQELKCSLQFSQRDIEDLTKNNERIELESKSARTDIKTMCETMIKITDKADYLEGQSKRNNVVVDGIPETQNESWKETEDKVRSVITETSSGLQSDGD